jgi:hypothetical protein
MIEGPERSGPSLILGRPLFGARRRWHSPPMLPSFMIIDDFLADPHAARRAA